MGTSNDNEPNTEHERRLVAVERKINVLVSLGIGQVTLLVLILLSQLASQLMPKLPTLLLLLSVIALIGYVFRKHLPAIIKWIGRYILGKVAASESTDTDTEIR